jgi:hypothetical protein
LPASFIVKCCRLCADAIEMIPLIRLGRIGHDQLDFNNT